MRRATSSKRPLISNPKPGKPRYRSSGVHGIQGFNLGKIYNERKPPSDKQQKSTATKDQQSHTKILHQREAAKQAEGIANQKSAVAAGESETKPKSLMDLLSAQNHTTGQNDKEGDEYQKKMSGHTGEGGSAGVEYEGGKPVAMKRGVRNNMFRLI